MKTRRLTDVAHERFAIDQIKGGAHFAQALRGDVQIVRRGQKAGVAKQPLHECDLHAALNEVRGKGVPQAVWVDLAGDAGAACEAPEAAAGRVGAEAAAPGALQHQGLRFTLVAPSQGLGV